MVFRNNSVGIETNNGIVNITTISGKMCPALLSKVLEILSEIADEGNPASSFPNPYEVDTKIKYNNVIKHKRQIQEYAIYAYYVEKAYETVEHIKPRTKTRILRYISLQYTKVLDNLLLGEENDAIIVIRDNSDYIIDSILKTLTESVLNSPSAADLHAEDIEPTLLMIVCKAFIDCKILEEPI